MHAILFSGLAALAWSKGAAAACSRPLVIDNFARYAAHANTLTTWTSDDATMVAISATNNVLSFTPKANSYFFETFPCQAAASNGYNSLQFKIKGPAGGSIRLELQTQISCMVTTYTSSFLAVEGLTGGTQTVTVPLSAFVGANLNAISSVVWFGFSSNNPGWQLSQVQLGCAAAGGVSVVVPAPLASGAVIPKPALTSSAPFRPSSTSNPRAPAAPGSCSQDLIVDDFVSQSRLTFLYYNALLQPSSDDATMKSVVVADNRVTLTPANRESYWFTQVGCTDAKNIYGGISMRIKAPPGTVFTVELGYKRNCADEDIKTVDVPTTTLNWAFDGTEKLYSLKWSQFPGVDASKLNTLLFSGLNRAVTVGPIALYCGDWLSEYIAPYKPSERPTPVATVPAPAGTHAPLVIDQFTGNDANALGFWHGGDEGLEMTWGNKEVKLVANDPDYAFYTQFAAGCKDITEYEGSYLHIAYSGSNAFSIALQQHNSQCNEKIAPYPETWDEIEAARYASASDIYVPISHFKIEKRRAIGFAIKSWYKTAPTTLRKIEIVPSVPAGFAIPSKLPSGQLIFACKRPNSFAFCIDDGNPEYAQEIMKVIREENIKVTFFTVGAPLLDPSTNLSNVYRDMLSQGHQIALHSYTHPKLEGLPTTDAIDWEYNNDIAVVAQTFAGLHTPYFRPPFGTEGARMRQRWAVASGARDPYIVNWSVDVEDWLWATGPTPEKQLDAFRRDVAKGGDLVVMHYLYPSTVGYLREFVRIAKATGRQLMRLDQCMMDPNAPPL